MKMEDSRKGTLKNTPIQPLRIVLLFNDTSVVERGNESDSLPDADLDSHQSIIDALESRGHTVQALGIHYENLHLLDTLEADFVLNLCDGTGLDGHPGLEVVAALENRGLPFSGASSGFYFTSSGKWRTKRRLATARVPAPFGVLLPSPEVPLHGALKFPLFVKPRDAYGSLGVDDNSLVKNEEELRARVAYVVDTFGTDALVEEYIAGRELAVALIGAGDSAVVLPPLEVTFGKAYDSKLKIRSYATKHDTTSDDYRDFGVVCPAQLDDETEKRVRQVALQAYRALGGDGYGRVDLRLSADGTPYVLEVNANCSLEEGESPEDCGLFPLICRAVGWDSADMYQALIRSGLDRPAPQTKAPLAMRWHHGRTTTHALYPVALGERLLPFGPVYPAKAHSSLGAFTTIDGKPVLVEPHVRHLDHAADPNLVPVRDGSTLWLEAARPIQAGELLTIDRRAPLDLPHPVTRPRPVGRMASAIRRRGERTLTP